MMKTQHRTAQDRTEQDRTRQDSTGKHSVAQLQHSAAEQSKTQSLYIQHNRTNFTYYNI